MLNNMTADQNEGLIATPCQSNPITSIRYTVLISLKSADNSAVTSADTSEIS